MVSPAGRTRRGPPSKVWAEYLPWRPTVTGQILGSAGRYCFKCVDGPGFGRALPLAERCLQKWLLGQPVHIVSEGKLP